jgi:hypothetical protein
MGTSFATNAFRVVRTALRRELLMGVTRMWDKAGGAVDMRKAATLLKPQDVQVEIAKKRSRSPHSVGYLELMGAIQEESTKISAVVAKYAIHGSHAAKLAALHQVRDERLAHRQKAPSTTFTEVDDDALEEFYQDTAIIMESLMHATFGCADSPSGLDEVFTHHARLFWEPVRGEKTPGHPQYKSPRNIATVS